MIDVLVGLVKGTVFKCFFCAKDFQKEKKIPPLHFLTFTLYRDEEDFAFNRYRYINRIRIRNTDFDTDICTGTVHFQIGNFVILIL